MHELSVCQGIIEQVIKVATNNNAIRVTKVIVKIGPLSGVEAPLLQHAFPIASAGTIAAEAILETEILPIKVHCNICNNENEATASKLLCSACGSWQTSLISGDEMLLQSIELDQSVQEKSEVEKEGSDV